MVRCRWAPWVLQMLNRTRIGENRISKRDVLAKTERKKKVEEQKSERRCDTSKSGLQMSAPPVKQMKSSRTASYVPKRTFLDGAVDWHEFQMALMGEENLVH